MSRMQKIFRSVFFSAAAAAMVWAALPVKVDAQAEFRGCLSSQCFRDCMSVSPPGSGPYCAEICCSGGRKVAQ